MAWFYLQIIKNDTSYITMELFGKFDSLVAETSVMGPVYQQDRYKFASQFIAFETGQCIDHYMCVLYILFLTDII